MFVSGRLTTALAKLAETEDNFSATKRETADEIHRLKVELESKESLILKTEKETEIAATENQKLTDFIKEQERFV